ncbi:MAG TPA: cobalt-precorrin-6A reductase [Amaricoccus sp.]|nr:cobalt-precorrin-6A reductase [Amaricoccus sp.]
MRRILILGGTTEARTLAARLAPRHAVTLSLAGRIRAAAPQPVPTRTGGFGGPEGLARYLEAEAIEVLVDATHPFARRISRSAREAAARTATPLLALSRPPWTPVPGDRWTAVPDMAAAARALGAAPARVFLGIGRQEASAFRAAPQHRYLLRCIEPPPRDALPGAEIITARGPFREADERALLEARRIDVLVSKNSGGAATYPKLAAARALGLPVVIVDRPATPGAAATVEELLARLDHLLASTGARPRGE